MSSFFRPWETRVAILAAFGIAAHLVLRFATSASPDVVLIPLWVVISMGGLPVLLHLGKKAFTGDFGSDLLAGISIVTAVLLAEHLVAAIVILMLTGGATLEQHATRRASAVLDALARRVPQQAHKKVQGHIVDIPLAEVAVGDTLIVMPHEICPVDGVVTATCAPTSGSTFIIGDTTVACSAVDLRGNVGGASFVVHVRGAVEQLDAIAIAIGGFETRRNVIDGLLRDADRARASIIAGRKAQACGDLDRVARPSKLNAADQALVTTSIRRIQSVIGC